MTIEISFFVECFKYMLVNFSRVPRDLVPSEARDQIKWRVKSLTTYLVHVLHEKSKSLLFLFNLSWPFSISLSFNQDYLNYCNSVSANSIISALKGILPVFHGQGREHSEQFLGILIITRSPPPCDVEQFHLCFKSVHHVFYNQEQNIVFWRFFLGLLEKTCVL